VTNPVSPQSATQWTVDGLPSGTIAERLDALAEKLHRGHITVGDAERHHKALLIEVDAENLRARCPHAEAPEKREIGSASKIDMSADWADQEAARIFEMMRDEIENGIAEALRRAPTTAFVAWQESWRREVREILDEADRRRSRGN
jgi:hypothetical protein